MSWFRTKLVFNFTNSLQATFLYKKTNDTYSIPSPTGKLCACIYVPTEAWDRPGQTASTWNLKKTKQKAGLECAVLESALLNLGASYHHSQRLLETLLLECESESLSND
jgi:hypothetical protein